MDLHLCLFISLSLFTLGIIGILTARNTLILFLSIEMMLNSSNLLFVAFSNKWQSVEGLVWVFFILVLAAAEAAVGLAIVINLFRAKQTVDVDQYNLLRG